MALARDERGAIAVMTALSVSVLLGFVSLAVEATSWEMTRIGMQTAADQAALAASFVSGVTNFTKEAKSVAAANGFTDGTASTTVTVNQPPTSGNYVTNNAAMEVVVSQQRVRLISSLFLSGTQAISVRAVAAPPSGVMCIMALDPNGSGSITLSGSSVVQSVGCDVYNDSTSATDTTLGGSSSLTTRNLVLAGNYSQSGSSTLNVSGTSQTNVTSTPDPYSNRVIPSYSGCNQTNFNGSGVINASAGTPYVFCGGLAVNGALTLGPGVYIIDGGNVSVASLSTLTATGATIILTSSTGTSYGTVNINGQSTVTVSAPSSGATAGIAVWVDKRAPLQNQKFTGGTGQILTGALYMPSQSVTYVGGSSLSSPCNQLVAYDIYFNGNAAFQHNCIGGGESDPGSGPGPVKLVE